MKDDKISLEDFLGAVDRAKTALKEAGAWDLVEHLQRIARGMELRGQGTYRVPAGLFSKPSNNGSRRLFKGDSTGLQDWSPDLICKIEHVVVTPETARSYELTSFRVAGFDTVLTGHSVPLEPFSIEFYKDSDVLYRAMKWEVPQDITPANKVYGIVKCLVDDPPPFRGVLWLRERMP